jgi:ubiquinone/menaquinone biosynthesis C-methylase UbiE
MELIKTVCNTEIYVKEVYEKIAEHFNDKRFSQWDWIEHFLDTFEKGSLVYDIGCGPGRNIRDGMIGVDNCHNFLKICSEKQKSAIYGDMTSLPLESESGIGLICIAAFHHLNNESDRLKALFEFKRVLKSGSRIMISIWSFKQGPEIKGNRKLKFNYGDNLVPWNSNGKIYQRYYYIFEIDEIENLFKKVELKIIDHFWVHGNEVYILET